MAVVTDYNGLVQQLFVAYFGRPADPIGLNSFSTALLAADTGGAIITAASPIAALQAAYSTNKAIANIVNSFGSSAESVALYGGTAAVVAAPYAFIDAIYENLFGRHADTSGLTAWGIAISQGAVTPADAALSIASTAITLASTDATTIQNKVAVAVNFTADLTTAAQLIGYSGNAAAAAARGLLQTVTSTTVPSGATQAAATLASVNAIANIVTGTTVNLPTTSTTQSAQIFNGVLSATAASNTLVAFDNLTGTAPTGNVLNIVSDGTTLPAGVTLTNIQTVNINSTADQSANTTGWTGVTALNIADTGAAPTTTGAVATTTAVAAITAAAGTAITVTGDVLTTGLAAGAGSLTVNGGSSVTITATGASTAADTTIGNIAVGGTTAAAGAVTVTSTETSGVAASTFGNVTVTGGTAVTINATENAAFATTAVQAGTITVTSATGVVTVNNTTNVTDALATTDAINGQAVAVTGGSSVVVNEVVTASAAALAFAALPAATVTDGVVTVLDGGTETSVTVNQTSSSATAALAAVGATGAVVTTPAGPGIAGATTAATAGTAAVAGVLAVTAGAVNIYGASAGALLANASNTITSVTLGSYGASIINSAVLTSLTLSGTGAGLTVYNVGTTPITTLALNLNALTDATGITETGITALNVTTGGAKTSSLGAFVDTGLKTLTVAGTQVFKLGGMTAVTEAALASITVSGAAGFSDGATTAATGFASLGALATPTTLTTTSSGAISVAIDDLHQTFVGSTGKDTIIISALADATKVITAGSATGNELILEGGAYALTAATALKVTGFQTLGVAANVTGPIDMSVIDAAASSLDIIGNSTIAFTKVATSASLSLDASSTSVSLKYVDANGAADTTAVTIGSATNAAVITATSVTLSDANLVGIGAVSIVSNESTAGAANVITTLVDNGLNHLSVSGAGGLTIGTLNEASTQATGFTFTNTDTGTAGVTIGAFTDASLGSLTFTGTGASTVTALADSGTTLAISNTGTGTAAIGTLTDTVLTSLTLGAGVALGSATVANAALGVQDSSAAGVTVSGAADNAHVAINLTAGAATTLADNITLGNGNNFVTDASTTGTVNVHVGTGSNLIDLHTGSTTSTTASALTAGTYVANVFLGAHTVTTGADSISVGTITGNDSVASTVISGTTATTSGVVAGDIVTIADATTVVGLTTTQQATVTAAATLAAAVALADGAAIASAAHAATVFQYGGNTYVLESVLGGVADAGTMVTGNALVELVGVHTVATGSTALTAHHIVLVS